MQLPQVSHLSVPCHIPVIPPKVIVFKAGWQILARTADVAWTPSPQEKISIESAFLISSSLGFVLERMSAFWHRKSISITPVTFFPSFSSLSFVLSRTAFPPVLAPSGQPPHPSINIFLSSFNFKSNKRLFIGARLSIFIFRRCIPGSRSNYLIIGNPSIFYV